MLIFVFLSSIISAQTLNSYVIEGQILDADKSPIEDAYIYNKSTNSHTHSSKEGKFRLRNNYIGDTIQVGLLGYEKYEVLLKKSSIGNPGGGGGAGGGGVPSV